MGYEFKVDAEAALKNIGGNGKIRTFVGEVTITKMALSTTSNGNNVIDISLTTADNQKGVVFGLCIDPKWKSGAENFDYPIWQKLVAVLGIKTGATAEITVKKKEGEVQVLEFTEAKDKTAILAIALELDAYKGEETDKLKIRNVFTESKQTFAEKAQDKTAKTFNEMKETIEVYKTKEWIAEFGSGKGNKYSQDETTVEESVEEDDIY